MSRLMTNASGAEVIVTGTVEARMREQGDWDKFTKRQICIEGHGPTEQILLDLRMNGLGDAIHALPAISEKVRTGSDVWVLTDPFVAPLFLRVGVTATELLHPKDYDAAMLAFFGRIYNLRMWCTEADADGEGERLTVSRFEQFARLIEVELPKEFDFRKWLL